MPVAAVGALGAVGTAATVVGTVASVAGAASQAKAAKNATAAQVAAAQNQIELDKSIYEDQKSMFAPYKQSGEIAQQILDYEMGIGPKPIFGATAVPTVEEVVTPGATRQVQSVQKAKGDRGEDRVIYQTVTDPGSTVFKVNDRTFTTREAAETYANSLASGGTEYRGFQATPGYDFRVKSANDALTNSVATRGSLFSGQTLKDLSALNQNLAADEYANYLARVEAAVNRGQASAGQTASAAGNMGSNIGVSNANIANAYASGAIARGNAIQSGISGLSTGLTSLFQPRPVVPVTTGGPR